MGVCVIIRFILSTLEMVPISFSKLHLPGFFGFCLILVLLVWGYFGLLFIEPLLRARYQELEAGSC